MSNSLASICRMTDKDDLFFSCPRLPGCSPASNSIHRQYCHLWLILIQQDGLYFTRPAFQQRSEFFEAKFLLKGSTPRLTSLQIGNRSTGDQIYFTKFSHVHIAHHDHHPKKIKCRCLLLVHRAEHKEAA